MTTEPPDVRERESEPSKHARRLLPEWSRRPQTIDFIVGLLVAGAVAVYLWTSDGGSDRPATARPQRGVACPHLREAFEQREAGNEVALRRSVGAAARASEEALNRSGQVFGRPEEIAIELQYVLAEDSNRARKDVAMYFAKAQTACEQLERWGSGG
jgi:hypothetical protein